MTRLGDFFEQKAVVKAEIGKRAGISKYRIGQLTNNQDTKLRADELYLIAKAMGVDPCELLQHVCGHLKLPLRKDL